MKKRYSVKKLSQSQIKGLMMTKKNSWEQSILLLFVLILTAKPSLTYASTPVDESSTTAAAATYLGGQTAEPFSEKKGFVETNPEMLLKELIRTYSRKTISPQEENDNKGALKKLFAIPMVDTYKSIANANANLLIRRKKLNEAVILLDKFAKDLLAVAHLCDEVSQKHMISLASNAWIKAGSKLIRNKDRSNANKLFKHSLSYLDKANLTAESLKPIRFQLTCGKIFSEINAESQEVLVNKMLEANSSETWLIESFWKALRIIEPIRRYFHLKNALNHKGLEQSSRLPYIYYDLGLASMSMKRYHESVRYFEQFLQKFPNHILHRMVEIHCQSARWFLNKEETEMFDALEKTLAEQNIEKMTLTSRDKSKIKDKNQTLEARKRNMSEIENLDKNQIGKTISEAEKDCGTGDTQILAKPLFWGVSISFLFLFTATAYAIIKRRQTGCGNKR